MRAWTIQLVVASSLGLGAFLNICGCSDETNPLDPSFGTVDLTDPPASDLGGEDVPFGPLLVTAEAFDPDNELRIRFVAEALDGRNPPFDSILWDFGDGSEGMGTRTVHEYAEEGEQVVHVEGFDCVFTTLEGDAETGTHTAEATPLLAFIIKIKRLKVTIDAEPGAGHAPLTTQFNGEVSLPWGHSVAGYQWDFGDGATASDSLTVQHTFAVPNSYPVTLTVVTSRDWAYEGTTIVDVAQANQPPQAQIQAVPLAGEAPLTVVFDGSASIDTDGEIVSYAWQFGDSEDASGQVVEHTYASEGDYTATLTVTDDDGASHTDEVIVHVDAAGPTPNQLPAACLEAEPATGTAPLDVTFDGRCSTDTDGFISSWLWDFGDGVSTAGAEVTHTYSAPGDYTATLTVIDNDGGRDQAEVVIHVNGAPTAEFVISLDYDVAPTVVHFSAANSSDADGQITYYAWQFGDGSIEEGPDKMTVDHTYAAGGAYIARLTVTDDDAAIARDTAWVVLGELAVAPPSLDFGDAGSQETIQISNTGSRNLEYNVSVDYGSGPDGWLSAVPAAGSCGAAQTVTVTIEDDRTVLPAGTHSAEIQVRAGNVTKTVGATIAVVAVATSIDSHDFGSDSTVCQFDVWNAGAGVLRFEVASQPDWVQVAGAPGTSSGAQDTQTLRLTPDRTGLAPGVYADDLVLSPAAGQGDLSKTIPLRMEVAEPGALSVSPADGLVSSGTQGGPFLPLSKTFTVSNGGQTALAWSVAKTQSWLTLSKSGGMLAPGGNDAVTVSIIAQQAEVLSAGTHNDTVTFTNTTNGDGNTTRTVELSVSSSSDCEASSVTWQNFSFAPQTGVFMAEFEATPSQANMDGVIALASGEGTTYGDFSVLVRFNQDGFIDVRDGGVYAADASVSYMAGGTYHFQMIVDVPAQGYEVRVDDAGDGSNWQTLASSYAFRTAASSLDDWGLIASVGSIELCDLTVQPVVATPTISPNGGNFTDSVEATLACATAGATIRYTIDGSDPSKDSTEYAGPLILTGTATIKTRAFKTAYEPSSMVSAEFNVTSDRSYVDSVSQYGITWTFDKQYQVGQFVTGDWWVIGPVAVTAIAPQPIQGVDMGRNGSMINPRFGDAQGYDGRTNAPWKSYDSSLCALPPFTLYPGDSLVSCISLTDDELTYNGTFVKTAAVLTVVDTPQQVDSFRPPFCRPTRVPQSANDPLIFATTQIQWDLLPRLPIAPITAAPEVSSCIDAVHRPWIDHFANPASGYAIPRDNMPFYGQWINDELSKVSLLLCFDITPEHLEALLHGMLQVGIDYYGTYLDGGYWMADAGIMNGRKWPIILAGVVLNHPGMKDLDLLLETGKWRFSEDGQTYYYDDPSLPEWLDSEGHKVVGEVPGAYRCRGQKGWVGKTNGGEGDTVMWRRYDNPPHYTFFIEHEHLHVDDWSADTSLQVKSDAYRRGNTSMSFVGIALAARLMNAVATWNHNAFFDYVDRWMIQDDTVAYELYVARYGEPGWLPHQGGASPFVKQMWSAYRGPVEPFRPW